MSALDARRWLRDPDQARRLERVLVAVRWFAAAFAVFQVFEAVRLDPDAPSYVAPTGYALAAALAGGNAMIALALRRAQTPDRLAAVGMAAFLFDIAATIGLIWNYSYLATNTVWVAMYILPLEGAIRYQLRGALFVIAVLAVSETLREVYVATVDPEAEFLTAFVTFRIGIAMIIALVAGFMSRSLEQAAQQARDRARLAEEAARRATTARKELAAFHTAVLAGVAATDLQNSLRSMVGTIGRDLGFQCLSILLADEEHLVAMARHGVPPKEWLDRIPFGYGVAGRVAAAGEPRLEPLAEGGAAAAAPLLVDGGVIGVLEVQNDDPAEVTEDTLDVLVRLADQLALVVHSAELRARQSETLERLQELDQMKSDFVAITSHELRTPLTAVRGFVRTLIRNFERLTPQQAADFLKLIDRQSERLTRLVEDLLVVSRIEAGTIAVKPETVELRPFVRDVVAAFGPDRERVEIEVDDTTPSEVVLDPNRMDQVLSNLLQNAMKFSPNGSPVRLGVRAVDGHIEFAVADRGIGISAEDLDQVFDRFHQAAPALTREAEGAGLGLYITKRLVEAMEGEVRVRSSLGEGSTFTVRVPFAADAERDPITDGQ